MSRVVGRETEWTAIEGFLDRCARGGHALVLEGPAGIGKSTLWLEAAEAARERGMTVLASRPSETERDLANVVLGDLFEGVDDRELARLSAPRRRAFEAALLRQNDAGPDDPVPVLDPRALGVAILTLLPALARDQPVVVAIDDDQWMDPSSAATLSFALRRIRGPRISLLVSRRTPDEPLVALEDAFDSASTDHLSVGPLSVGALHTAVRERLGATLPRPKQLRLHEVSGGNPFYAIEIARAGWLEPSADGIAGATVPPSLERLIAARTGALDDASRAALLVIAAHGRFPVTALAALAISPDSIAAARHAGLIQAEHGVLRFEHPVLASALYTGATSDDRRAAHRRLATVVEDPIHRARHLALGAEDPDADLAATIESAALVARDRGLSGATAELAEQALRLAPSEDAVGRHRLAVLAGRAYVAAGELGRARSIFSALLAGASTADQRAEALVLGSELESPPRAIAMLERAIGEAGGIPRLEADIHVQLAEHLTFGSAQWASAEWHAREALRLAEQLDDDSLRTSALSVLAVDAFCRARTDALETAERAYRLAVDLPDATPRTKGISALGLVLTWMGRTDRAREVLEPSLADIGDRDERARQWILWYLALVELWAGRWDMAAAYAEEASALRAAYSEPFGDMPSAFVALHQGDFERARSTAEGALAAADDAALLESYFGVLGSCELWRGHADAAIVQFDRAERAADAVGSIEPSFREWRPEMIEALVQLGRVDEAETLTTSWETAAQRLGRERVLAQALRCRGLITSARGDLPGALKLLEAAIDGSRAAGDPFGEARAILVLGMTRRRDQQKRSAREALEAALAGFERLGAASWAATTRAELAKVGGRSRISGLSPSEESVAALVAEGQTNREIAAALFLGERTVASHLTHIYSKLGVRSRTELARHLASKVPTS